MKNKKLQKQKHNNTRIHALGAVELKGEPKKEVSVRVSGKEVIRLSGASMAHLRARGDDIPSKQEAIKLALHQPNLLRKQKLLRLMNIESLLHTLLSFEEIEKLQDTKEQMLNDPDQAQLEYARQIITEIIKPTGMDVIITTGIGIEIKISINNQTHNI